MRIFESIVLRIAKIMDGVGGIILTLMVFITVIDVVLRFFKKPITGTYELVFLGGAIVIGCAIPMSSWEQGHVYVDFLLDHFSAAVRKATLVCTRCLGIAFFFFLGWNLFSLGRDLLASGEVSLTLHVPYYPVAFMLGLCAFAECLMLFLTMVIIIRGGAHE